MDKLLYKHWPYSRARRLVLRHRALLLSAVAIGMGASTEIDQPSSEKQFGYTLDYNTPYFQMSSSYMAASLENLPFIQQH